MIGKLSGKKNYFRNTDKNSINVSIFILVVIELRSFQWLRDKLAEKFQ